MPDRDREDELFPARLRDRGLRVVWAVVALLLAALVVIASAYAHSLR